MALQTTDWLITSDTVREVAFRVDLPEEHQGMWVLSYLPTDWRITREQAVAGLVLAEAAIAGQLDTDNGYATELARLRASELGATLPEVLWLLAVRAPGCGVRNEYP